MKYLSLTILFFGMLAFTACQSDGETNAAEDSPEVVDQTNNEDQVQNPREARAASREETNNRADQTPEAPKGPSTTVAFENDVHDFGTIKDGDKVKHTFVFTNTGSDPLILSNARGSCGCTVPEWPRDPIPPGETGKLTVEYDSRNKGSVDGKVDTKFVTVTANTEPRTHRLTIRANVVKENQG